MGRERVWSCSDGEVGVVLGGPAQEEEERNDLSSARRT